MHAFVLQIMHPFVLQIMHAFVSKLEHEASRRGNAIFSKDELLYIFRETKLELPQHQNFQDFLEMLNMKNYLLMKANNRWKLQISIAALSQR
eukprot:5141457-Pleurochrysis_carterae.AAC.1